MTETRWPAATCRDAGADLDAPRPENSWPRICGSTEPLSGCGCAGMTIGPIAYSCRSVPQMPHQSGRSSTSPGPGAGGSATSSTRMSCCAVEDRCLHARSLLSSGSNRTLPSSRPGGQPLELVGERRRAGARQSSSSPAERRRRRGCRSAGARSSPQTWARVVRTVISRITSDVHVDLLRLRRAARPAGRPAGADAAGSRRRAGRARRWPR